MNITERLTVGIIAGLQGHWNVNQEQKMAEVLLRSCQEGMNKNKMSINQKVKLKLKLTLTFQKKCIICFVEITMMKNAFYFILKALFILKIFKFLSGLFGHVGKTA